MNTVSHAMASAHRTGHGVEQHHPRPHPTAHAGTQQPESLQSHAIAALQSIDLPLGGKPYKPPKNTLPPWQRPEFTPCVLRPLGTVQTRTVG